MPRGESAYRDFKGKGQDRRQDGGNRPALKPRDNELPKAPMTDPEGRFTYPGVTNAGEGEFLNKPKLPGGTGTGATKGSLVKPKVDIPDITPPSISPEQAAAGEMQTQDKVQPKTVAGSQQVSAKTTQTPQAKAQTAQAQMAGAPEDVQAADYVATQVDPKAAQVEAATTDYQAKVEAAQATTPQDALVSEQMKELTQGLESGEIPLWARGAVDAVDAQLAQRGLSRSSIGQADLTRAILGAALPIAQQNAQAVQQTSLQNLQNRQTANNLQAQLQTNVELANLSNEQQARLSNQASQQAIMLSNQAAENAGKQFNAQSKNQVDTFMANLRAQTEQFNTAQANAMTKLNTAQVNATNLANVQLAAQTEQFNAAQTNAMARFNEQVAVDLRKYNADMGMRADMFNKQNAMVIAQSNAQWRRQIATADTQRQHEATLESARNRFNLSMADLNNYWQVARDYASWAWQSTENALSRQAQIYLNSKNNAAAKEAAKMQSDAAKEAGWADAIGTITAAGLQYWLQD